MLTIGGQYLPLLLNIFGELDNGLPGLKDIKPSRALLKDTPIKLEQNPIDIATPQIPFIDLSQRHHLLFGEAAGESAELAVPEVHEQDVAGVFLVEVFLPEDPVVQRDRCALV